MGTKTEAIVDDPDRFFQYLSEEDKMFIFSGRTQSERVMRLKQRFETFFLGETDTRGRHFVDDDLTGDENYNEALMKLYNCAPARTFRDEHFPDIHKRKRKKEIEEIIRKPRPAPTVKEQPKKIISTVSGYYNKQAKKWIEPYQRTISQSWSKREVKWVFSRMAKENNIKLAEQFNVKFGTTRTVSSIGTKKLRIRKQEAR